MTSPSKFTDLVEKASEFKPKPKFAVSKDTPIKEFVPKKKSKFGNIGFKHGEGQRALAKADSKLQNWDILPNISKDPPLEVVESSPLPVEVVESSPLPVEVVESSSPLPVEVVESSPPASLSSPPHIVFHAPNSAPTPPLSNEEGNESIDRPESGPKYSPEFLFSLRDAVSPLHTSVGAYIKSILDSHTSAASRPTPRQNNNRGGGRGGRGGNQNPKQSHSRNSSKVHTPMPKSANAYDVQEQKNKAKQDGLFAVLKETKGSLNKLSESNKEKIFSAIVQIFNRQHPCSKDLSDEQLEEFKKDFVTHLFDKAVLEPTFVNLYSQLCLKLSKEFVGFSKMLIAQCQANFEKFFIEDTEISEEISGEIDQVKRARFINDGEVTETQILAERFYRENKLKAKVLGNVEFVASLILHSVIPPNVASVITKQLVQNFKKVMAIEGLITLWKKLLESAGINEYIETVVAKHIEEFSTCMDIPIRERCLCANWMDYYVEKQGEQAQAKARLTSFSQDVRNVADDDGFVAVPESKKKRQPPVVQYSSEKTKKFADDIDKMGITELMSEFLKLRLSESDKTAFVADVLYHFTNLNKPLLRDQFQSIMKGLVKDKKLTNTHCANGLSVFCKDGKYDDLLEDFPKAGEFLAPILSSWLHSRIVNREQLIDSLVNIDPFNLSGLVTPFVEHLKENDLECDWLEQNEKVCSIVSSL
ncbi:hypothetical protein GEMRC1_002555 [Eukaryota sp. GEM-RC1]